MVKEVGFFSVRRYEIPAGELLFNTPYSFLSVRFGYGNQLLSLLGLLGFAGLHGFLLPVSVSLGHYLLLERILAYVLLALLALEAALRPAEAPRLAAIRFNCPRCCDAEDLREALIGFRRGPAIKTSCESGGNRSGTYDCERCIKPNTYALI